MPMDNATSAKPAAAAKRRAGLILVLPAVLALYTAVNYYVGWHGELMLRALDASRFAGIYWTLFALAAFGLLLGRLPGLPGAAKRLLKVAGYCHFGVLQYALLLLPLADLAYLAAKPSSAEPESVRRLVLLLGGAVLALMAAVFARGFRNARSPVVRAHDLEIPKPAGRIRRLHIAVVSDLHLGHLVGNRHLDRLLREMNRLRPDLILLAGDVIDDDIEPYIRNRMGERLKRLRAPLGVYAVLGNHEYYSGKIEAFVREMADAGITVLRDEAKLVGGAFYVVGRKDRTAESADPEGRKPVASLVAPLDAAKPILVMDHQPTSYGEAEAAGADLMISGHTHRGQMAPNHWITRRLFELDWGYKRKGNMHAVVSSGFGTWGPPLRLMSRSEIVLLRVRFAEPSEAGAEHALQTEPSEAGAERAVQPEAAGRAEPSAPESAPDPQAPERGPAL
ncbi:MAG: hypothetical protein BAA02_11200 [Paenibacillaceae bacterium ZCTH02-B3]|nr:MAG: hypothetical protein BAA02_11200 [Paenibacillaceae bacterium ZCTH02-B3]